MVEVLGILEQAALADGRGFQRLVDLRSLLVGAAAPDVGFEGDDRLQGRGGIGTACSAPATSAQPLGSVYCSGVQAISFSPSL